VAGFKALFQISTKSVNKYVEKPPLDTRKACPDAGYNKLPPAQAKQCGNQIKHLASDM
jgi:hypothetical protein